MPAGFDGTFKMATGFFAAEHDDWKAVCRKTVLQLKGAVERGP